MTNCSSCDRPVQEGTDFCPVCGTPAKKSFFGMLGRFFGGKRSAFSSGPPEIIQPAPPADAGGAFSLTVEDVFAIAGRGVVVTGKVACGTIKAGDKVSFRTGAGADKVCRVTGIEMFRKLLDAAAAGDCVGLLLSDLQKGEILPGAVLTRPQ